MLAGTATSTVLHYVQLYRSTLARLDGLFFQISGPLFVALELRSSQGNLITHLATILPVLYAAVVFFVCLRGAWYDPPGVGKFRPYSTRLLLLHVSVHVAGVCVGALTLFALRQVPSPASS